MTRHAARRRRRHNRARRAVSAPAAALLALALVASGSVAAAGELPPDGDARPADRGAPGPAPEVGPEPTPELGIELQLYPAGAIGSLHARLPLSDRGRLTLRAGYNLARRGSAGEHDDESGGGLGASVGYRYLLGPRHPAWSVGGRVDLWSLDIDWRDDLAGGGERRGSTRILVAQPTAIAGRAWATRGRWSIEATVALGFEINVRTRGEDVGEGAILLGGVTLLRRR